MFTITVANQFFGPPEQVSLMGVQPQAVFAANVPIRPRRSQDQQFAHGALMHLGHEWGRTYRPKEEPR